MAERPTGSPSQLPFFVYGTLRPGLVNHDRHLTGRCAEARPAVLAGAALHEGPGFPYAVPAPGRRVVGDLLTIRPDVYARVLTELDELEECRPDGSGLYVRVQLPVLVTDAPERRTRPAWVYLAGPAQAARLRAAPTLIPSGDWTDRWTAGPA
ncbi:gamma-glutamylcyclotransferase family protein [Kitasatospora sp. NPDC052896]|uniref:gamma-glutamylcyclotransferase family protein n=1 Tax=Kitasatospora sp. NPDC052896 TaxID=3364061 RepID=UPI0037C5DC7B